MKYYVLASGSKGNCTVITSGDDFIIIDAGAPKRQLKNGFQQLGIDYMKANGLLLTHTHSDHIKSVDMFAGLDAYSCFDVEGCENYRIRPYETFKIGVFTITAIPLSHDVFTVGYIIFDGQQTLVYITDTGYVSNSNRQLIQSADYYIFESNYDLEMLMNSPRPLYLKQRINGDSGHLSNEDSANILNEVIGRKTKEICLAHLSEECNLESLALETLKDTLKEKASGIKIQAARQREMVQGGQD